MNKKTKKKIVLFLVILSMFFLLSGCNSGGSDDNSSAKTQFVTVMTGIIPEGVEKETNNILPTGVVEIKGISPEEKSKGMYKFRLKKNNDYTATISDTNDIFETRNIKFNSGNGSSVIYLTTSSMLNGLSINVADSLGNITTNESLSIEGSDLQKISDGKYNANLKEGETYKLISNENGYFKAKEKSFEFTGQESIDFELERKEYEYTVEIRDSQNNLIPTAEIDDPAFEETSTEGVFKATLKAGLDYDIHITDSSSEFNGIEKVISVPDKDDTKEINLFKGDVTSTIKATTSEGDFEGSDLHFEITGGNKTVISNSEVDFDLEGGKTYVVEVLDNNDYFKSNSKSFTAEDGKLVEINLDRKEYEITIEVKNSDGNLIDDNYNFDFDHRFTETSTANVYKGNLKAGLDYQFDIGNSTFSEKTLNISVENEPITKDITLLREPVEMYFELDNTDQTAIDNADFNIKIDGKNPDYKDNSVFMYELEKDKEYQITITDDNDYFEEKQYTTPAYSNYDPESPDMYDPIFIEKKNYEITLNVYDENSDLLSTAEIDDPAFEETSTEGVFKATFPSNTDKSISVSDTDDYFEPKTIDLNVTNSDDNINVDLERQTYSQTIDIKTNINEYDADTADQKLMLPEDININTSNQEISHSVNYNTTSLYDYSYIDSIQFNNMKKGLNYSVEIQTTYNNHNFTSKNINLPFDNSNDLIMNFEDMTVNFIIEVNNTDKSYFDNAQIKVGNVYYDIDDIEDTGAESYNIKFDNVVLTEEILLKEELDIYNATMKKFQSPKIELITESDTFTDHIPIYYNPKTHSWLEQFYQYESGKSKYLFGGEF